jgi:hypothetical protein
MTEPPVLRIAVELSLAFVRIIWWIISLFERPERQAVANTRDQSCLIEARGAGSFGHKERQGHSLRRRGDRGRSKAVFRIGAPADRAEALAVHLRGAPEASTPAMTAQTESSQGRGTGFGGCYRAVTMYETCRLTIATVGTNKIPPRYKHDVTKTPLQSEVGTDRMRPDNVDRCT